MRLRTLLLLLTCVAAGACGQTGALTLPDEDGDVVSSGPDSTVATPAADPATETEATRKPSSK